MPSLLELQQAFAASLATADNAPVPPSLLPCLVADHVAADERLAVYRNNARHNAREALRAVYPVVEQLVGARFFDHAADRYAAAHPSTSGDIHAFGGQFAAFLAAFEPAAGLAYLPDVARLEWAMHEVFHAAAAPPFPLERLAGVAESGHAALRFVFNPACRLVASAWPVHRLWALHQPGAVWDEAFDIHAGGVDLLFSAPAAGHARHNQVIRETTVKNRFMVAPLAPRGRGGTHLAARTSPDARYLVLQSSFRMVPRPRFFVNRALLLRPNRSR